MRADAASTGHFSGTETPTLQTLPWKLNQKHMALWNQLKAAEKRGDVAEIARIEKDMENLGIRSSRVLPSGELEFFGAPPGEGKMKTGGMVKDDVQSSLASTEEVMNGIY